jgi:protein-tyrosine-phosphatase/DNA-binding transcriptional ArsR family regulator
MRTVSISHLEPPAILPLVADPRRWQLLVELSRSDRRVGELTELLQLPQNLVSYHLRELRRAALVTSRRSSADGRDVYYRAHLTRCRQLLADAATELHPAVRLAPASPPSIAPLRTRPPRVLFLCTGNSARSQMAEALLAHRSQGYVEARSAGSHPKPLHPDAVRVLRERGIDIAGATTKHFRRFARARFHRVVTLCDKVREVCPEFPGPALAVHWSIADPAAAADGDRDRAFHDVADELDERIALLLTELAVPDREQESP